MESYVLEIRDAEGGQDSKLLVDEMFNIYNKVMLKNNFKFDLIERNSGLVVI